MIGPKDADGEESYDIEVCTPLWLLDHYTPTDIICGRHLLIVQHYDFKAIKNYIEKYVRRCNGKTWDDIALKLSRLGRSEFEDDVE